MAHPKAIGDRTTLAVKLALQDVGYAILIPFGENTRYDLVIDDGRKLSRVQCKTGRLREGAIRFSACSTYSHHPNPKFVRRDYAGQVDFFGVYCTDTGGVYLVPIKDANVQRQGNLRVSAPRNGQARRIRFAARYEIANLRPPAA
jgi:PD-(D/E)XK endonuclease